MRQGFLTQDLVGSFAGRLNTLGSFPFWSDRGNGWPSERALSRHGLRGERLAAGWAGLAITKSNTAREALACFGTPDDLLIAVRQGFLTQDLVGSFAGRLNMLG